MAPAQQPTSSLISLKIRDFRGIDQLDFDFRGPDGRPNRKVILSGPNGSGKTAVLEAVLLAVGGHKRASGPIDRRAIRKGAEDYSIAATFSDQDGTESEVVITSSTPAPATSPPSLWYFSSWREPNLIGAVNVTAGRQGKRPAKTDSNRLRNVKQQLVNAAAEEFFPGAKRPMLRAYSDWIADINEAWKRFYPNRDAEFSVGLVEMQDVGGFDVYYRESNQAQISVDDLSAGQLELFLLIAALVLNDRRSGFVLVDEPELHLDPQWHAPIVRTLVSLQPSAQFFITTHSPDIYDSAMSYERHFLVPMDDPRARAWPKINSGV